MEVVSGVASATQLLAYSHSTFQVLIKLYKQVRDGPASLKHQQSSVLVLLSVVDGLQRRPAPTHILTTLLELSALATEALNLIEQVQKKGFLGLSWSAVRHEHLIKEVFASLRDKREVLHLAISVESMSNRGSSENFPTDDASEASTIPGDMRLRNWKFWRSVKHTDTGKNNSNIIGNGEMPDRGVIRIQTNISGSGGFNYIGNVQDFSPTQHHSLPNTQQDSRAAGESLHVDTGAGPTADNLTEPDRGLLPLVPQDHQGRGRAIESSVRRGQLTLEQSHPCTIRESSSNPSSPSELGSPCSLGSSVDTSPTSYPGQRWLRGRSH